MQTVILTALPEESNAIEITSHKKTEIPLEIRLFIFIFTY